MADPTDHIEKRILQQPHAGKPFEFVIDRIEPMRLFSFRWHPFAVEPGMDYSNEPSTRVVFELEEAAGGPGG